MSIAALSSAGFSQYVASSSNINASQEAFQALQQSLASGNLTAAQAAFNSYQSLNQNAVDAGGGATSSSSQFAADLNALGSAIASGDLSASQAAFATLQSDLQTTASPAVAAGEAAAAQTVTWIEDLLSTFNSSSPTPTSTDPTTEILDSAYGLNSFSTPSSPGAAAATTPPASGDTATGSDASSGIDVYA